MLALRILQVSLCLLAILVGARVACAMTARCLRGLHATGCRRVETYKEECDSTMGHPNSDINANSAGEGVMLSWAAFMLQPHLEDPQVELPS